MLSIGQLYGQAVLNQTIPAELAALPTGAQTTSVGFVYNNGVDAAVTGNIKLYLENSTTTANTKSTTWATAITGMNTSVKSIYFELDSNTNITGNQLQAILIDTGGVVIDSSAVITVVAARLGSRVSMPLTGNNMITAANSDYYIGIRQFANATVGYFPIESNFPENVPTGRYFGFGIAGGTPSAPYTTLGTLGIGEIIEVEPLVLSNSDANDSICPGESVTFIATGNTASYEFFDGGTSVQSGTSGTYSTSLSATSTITA